MSTEPMDESMEEPPYVLVSIVAEHDDPYRASELLRRAVPADDPPEGWLWFYVRPERRDRFQVVVLMERRPEGYQPLLDMLEGAGLRRARGPGDGAGRARPPAQDAVSSARRLARPPAAIPRLTA